MAASKTSPSPTPVGLRVKAAREAAGLGVNELTALAGIGQGVLTRIENGRTRNVEAATLSKLAPHLGVSVDELLRGGDEPTPLTPPVRSTTRRAERPDVEKVQGWFFEVLQELRGERRYPPEEVRPAMAFLLSGAPLAEKRDPRRLVLGALEAARALRAAGSPTEPADIQAYLIEKNAPPSGPEPGSRAADAALTYTQNLITEEKVRMVRDGHVPPRRRR